MTDYIRQKKIKQIQAYAQIDCEHNHLTKGKKYEILDIGHEEDGDYFVFVDDSGENNYLHTDFFDISNVEV